MTFSVKVQPAGRLFQVQRDETLLAAAIRQGLGLPYGCKDGACGSCKSRLLEGRVIHGAHQLKALSAEEEAQGYLLTCCATPQTDCSIESRQVTALGQYPIVKMPMRVNRIDRAAPDVAVLTLQLPANQSFQYHAGQYIEILLRDGSRRSYSMATAPSRAQGRMELHIRHMPGGLFTDHVFSAMKDKEILRAEGPYGSFFLREESRRCRSCCWLRAPGLCADQGRCWNTWPTAASPDRPASGRHSGEALTLAARRLFRRAALFLWKMPLSATESITLWADLKRSAALALSPPATAFCTFLTTVRKRERSEVLAALSTTSWRARLRPEARRTVFFLALERWPCW
jgi:ferredoxin